MDKGRGVDGCVVGDGEKVGCDDRDGQEDVLIVRGCIDRMY